MKGNESERFSASLWRGRARMGFEEWRSDDSKSSYRRESSGVLIENGGEETRRRHFVCRNDAETRTSFGVSSKKRGMKKMGGWMNGWMDG